MRLYVYSSLRAQNKPTILDLQLPLVLQFKEQPNPFISTGKQPLIPLLV